MSIDKDKFFRDFTLNICSSLHIEVAMCNTLNMLSDYMPADEMMICMYNYENKTYKIIAKATKKDGILLNQVHTLPPNAEHYIRRFDRTKAKIFSSVKDDIIINSIRNGKSDDSLTCLLIPLTIDSHVIGSVQFYTAGPERYTKEHVELMSLVNQPFCIAVSNALEHIDLLQFKNKLNEENTVLKRRLQALNDTEVVGSADGMEEVMEMVNLVAPLNSPVLILGETGTGKEVIANAIYKNSSRNKGPFVKVNCGAIPEALIDSELFGHEKGSFTGALAKKIGRFERAHMGTIFLDEIGELPLEAQVRLLRVIQEKEIERVGGITPIPIDIRIICATNRNLSEMVTTGTFREDLFFRINVFPIMIPPLRQRTKDIPLLIEYFLQKKANEMGLKHIPDVPPEEIDVLSKYHWPGNVRELQNIIERALILCKGEKLSFHNILPELYHPLEHALPNTNIVTPSILPSGNDMPTLDDTMKQTIINALIQTKGRISGDSGAAVLLGMNPSTLRNRMIKLNIKNVYR